MNKKIALALLGCAALAAGCRQDMHDQPKYIPMRASEFYQDGRSSRMPVANTIAYGNLRDDAYFYSGKINGVEGDRFPLPVTKELLARGQERFNIYCSPCHSRVGDGRGMVPSRGFNKSPASLQDERLKKIPIGHFYDVMTNGFGSMLNYSAQIKPEDRWAIAAYVRALQLSQDARQSDVPAGEKIEQLDLQVHSPNPLTGPAQSGNTFTPASGSATAPGAPATNEGAGAPQKQPPAPAPHGKKGGQR